MWGFFAKLNNCISHLFMDKITACINEITIDGEMFTRLNIHGFSAIKVSRKYFHVALAVSAISTIEERHLYSCKNFHNTETVKNKKVEPSKSFPIYSIQYLAHNNFSQFMKN